MNDMRAVNLYGPDDFRVIRTPRPTCGANDVLLKVSACGICGSDLGYVASGGLMGPGNAPMPLGHELVGNIVELGSAVDAPHLTVGRRVVLDPMAGDNNIGNGGPEGGFADYLLVRNAGRAPCLYPVPEALPEDQAALVEPLAVGMHAVNQGDACEHDKAVVFGVGPVGLAAVVALSYRGVADIVAVDFSRRRLELALQMGASATLNPAKDQIWDMLRDWHGSETLFGMPMSATDLAIDASGSSQVFIDAVANLRPAGRLVVVGLHKHPVELDLMQVLMKELMILGSIGYPSEFPDVISMLESGEVDVAPMVSAHFELDRFDEAFALAKQPEHGGKVIVTP